MHLRRERCRLDPFRNRTRLSKDRCLSSALPHYNVPVMRVLLRSTLSSALFVLGVSFSQPASAQLPSKYTFTRLNATFPNTDQTIAHGINDLGWIVGTYHNPTGNHGFVLQRGVYTSLDVPEGSNTIGFGINVWGEIVGRFDATNGMTAGFLYSNGRFTTLEPPFPGVYFTIASSINLEGDVVGWYSDGQGSHGFLYEHGRFSKTDVPFNGVTGTVSTGMNDLGQVVGSYGTTDGKIHAFLEDHGTFQNIDATPGGVENLANGINDRDQIVVGGGVLQRGVLFPFSVQLPNVNSTNALGINNLDQIVGIYGTSLTDGQELSFLATPSR